MNRINKSLARKEYNKGNVIHIIPCNTSIHNIWGIGELISKHTNGNDFDRVVNAYEVYNCNNELGRYCAYYTID